ncbi:hypothetical protein CerSpe_244020 [Prunus speciosa]
MRSSLFEISDPLIICIWIPAKHLEFLQKQSVYFIANGLHIGITYGLVHWTALGFFLGAPLAASISLWQSVLMLAFNVNCTKSFEHTWEGFLFESLDYIVTGLKLALPSATMEL